ncbi:MAG: DUF6993 domain-containing protein [Leucobacter sp.]
MRTRTAPSNRRSLAAFALVLGALVPALAGCTLFEGPTPDAPKRETPAVPEKAPEFFPHGTAEQNLPYFTEVIRDFAKSDEPVRGEPVAQAVIDSGFDRGAMQVSFDRTQTGLEADNIFVSVRIGEDCLIGQVVAEDRSFVAVTEPAVGPERDICLIGETRPIDW